MKFNKDFHKVKTKSRTAIIFDKNEPILTNYATTRFKPGISIGAKAGYNIYSKLEKSESYFVGATISPFKSYRWYWQAELLNSLHLYDDKTTTIDDFIGGNDGTPRQLRRTIVASSNNNINWEVPLLIRYNINNFIGIGAGIQANINVSESQEQNRIVENYEGPNTNFLLSTKNDSRTVSESFTGFKKGLLLDLTLGAARIGPSLGARYVVNFEENFNYIQLYGIWKF
jgi:hypothetical protein